MLKEEQQVREFMLKAGQKCPDRPTIPDAKVGLLRAKLIREELDELILGFVTDDLVEIADAIADLLVVTLGASVACGIDIEPIFQEVVKSNLTKFLDGHMRADGKWIKGKSYSPPNLKPIIESQIKNEN